MATLLVIDDSATHRREIVDAIEPHVLFGSILQATDGPHGLKLLLGEEVDFVVCDLEMPGFDGEKILHIKQASPVARPIPIIFLTASGDRDRKARLLELGAQDVLDKPFYDPDLIARIKLHMKTKRLYDELRAKSDLMTHLSTTDAVTGLRTRRYATEVLAIEVLRARRYDTPVSVLMADLDHFKQVNDEYGHQAGDEVLAGVSKVLLDRLRATDVAGRYGGEEILVVLSQNDAAGAQVVAERWRMDVEEAAFGAPDGRRVEARISIGVASWDPSMGNGEALIARADAALYEAKDRGRNQVVIDAASLEREARDG